MTTATAHVGLQGVHAHIGQYHILHGIDFEVPSSKVTMLLGRNGAGKSTTVKTIMGIVPATSGRVMLQGGQIAGPQRQLATFEIARLGIGYVPEDMGVFTQLTVRQNLEVAAFRSGSLAKVEPQRLEWLLSVFPFLKSAWNSAAGTLSGGQRQMLSIARAILEPKDLLIIDEPSKGLAPVMVRSMIDALQALKATSVTILIVEQNMAVARAIGDHAVVLEDGRVNYRGFMTDLAKDAALQRSLIGLNIRRPSLEAT